MSEKSILFQLILGCDATVSALYFLLDKGYFVSSHN